MTIRSVIFTETQLRRKWKIMKQNYFTESTVWFAILSYILNLIRVDQHSDAIVTFSDDTYDCSLYI